MDTVDYAVAGQIATLTLNRAGTLNAYSFAMAVALIVGLDRAVADSDVEAVIVTGNGRVFCEMVRQVVVSANPGS